MNPLEKLRAVIAIIVTALPFLKEMRDALAKSQEDNARKDAALAAAAAEIAALQDKLAAGSSERAALEAALAAVNAALADERAASAQFAADTDLLADRGNELLAAINADPVLPNVDPDGGIIDTPTLDPNGEVVPAPPKKR